MIKRTRFIAALAATTFLTAGVAFAADQAQTAATQQSALSKDVGKLSADGATAYNDVALTRLAIFDGRIADAKKFVNEADADFDKAKTDESIFVKAEADLKAPPMADHADAAKADATKTDATKSDTAKSDQTDAATKQEAADAKTPKRWLPVDAEMSLNEDYTASPKKAAAVAEANKSLAKGDKQGAMETLKLADVDVDYVMAVVPLDQTLKDVHEAATMVNDGKYYEASQELRMVQASTRFDVLDISGVPKTAASQAPAAKTEAPKTH